MRPLQSRQTELDYKRPMSSGWEYKKSQVKNPIVSPAQIVSLSPVPVHVYVCCVAFELATGFGFAGGGFAFNSAASSSSGVRDTAEETRSQLISLMRGNTYF